MKRARWETHLLRILSDRILSAGACSAISSHQDSAGESNPRRDGFTSVLTAHNTNNL